MDMAKTGVFLTSTFDDLIRHYDQCFNHNTASEFLEFVTNQEECRKKWQESEEECVRLQNEVFAGQNEISRQERITQEVRKHLDSKIGIVNKLENANERLELRNNSARSLIKAYLNDGRISSESRERLVNILAVLETGNNRRANTFLRSSAGGLDLDTSSEVGSTDLSMTQSEDDLDLSGIRTRQQRPKRPSMEHYSFSTKKQRKSVTDNTIDQLITKTVVSFPKDGSIHAMASLETVPASSVATSSKVSKAQLLTQPTVPPMSTSTSESESEVSASPRKAPAYGQYMGVGDHSSVSMHSTRLGRTVSASSAGAMAMRTHAFCQKIVIKPETCGPCGRRIKFSRMALKCRDCKAACHPECKDKVSLPCVATLKGTLRNKSQMGTNADQAPNSHQSHPMIPGFVQRDVSRSKESGRKVYFTDDSLNETPRPRQKRTFFD